MRKALLFVLMSIFLEVGALEKLPEVYTVSFGNPEANFKVVEYFSFHCPHCLALFRKDFKKIKENLIDSNKVYWVFHPVPQDLPTVQAMACFEKLTESEKCLFLEVMLEEADIQDPKITSKLMEKAMEIFQKPLPKLQEEEFLSNTESFQEAFKFLKQDDVVDAVPVVEINGKIFSRQVPDYDFISIQYSAFKGKRS
jgi:Thioredoxin